MQQDQPHEQQIDDENDKMVDFSLVETPQPLMQSSQTPPQQQMVAATPGDTIYQQETIPISIVDDTHSVPIDDIVVMNDVEPNFVCPFYSSKNPYLLSFFF